MQAGNLNQRAPTEYFNYQRARRIDAEPMICEAIKAIHSHRLFLWKIRFLKSFCYDALKIL